MYISYFREPQGCTQSKIQLVFRAALIRGGSTEFITNPCMQPIFLRARGSNLMVFDVDWILNAV